MAENNQEPATPSILIISRSTVLPSPRQEGSSITHLTPWDLQQLSLDYIQKGILLPKPPSPLHLHLHIGQAPINLPPLLSLLVSSLSQTLGHFSPLAGRISTIRHDDDDPSLSVLIDCNNAGAELVVAAATGITTSDILTSLYVPDIVRSFFPLNGAISLDGRSLPLLGIQLTELSDGGVFIGCSANHAVVDGTSFWHFLNSWSEISRTQGTISCPPVLDRWLPDSINPPVRLPFADPQEFTRRLARPPGLNECFFHFSARSVKDLKARANSEVDSAQISSLQALLAHLWRSVARARKLEAGQESSYFLAGGQRSKTDPPLPAAYFGNSVNGIRAKALAGDIMSKGLGWVAWQLNRAVAAHAATSVQHTLKQWCKEPTFTSIGGLSPCDLLTGSSPRFNVYGNDFGWGKPVAVRSGGASKIDGKATVYPGPEEGSMALEVCLSAGAMRALVDDMEFMEAVGHGSF